MSTGRRTNANNVTTHSNNSLKNTVPDKDTKSPFISQTQARHTGAKTSTSRIADKDVGTSASATASASLLMRTKAAIAGVPQLHSSADNRGNARGSSELEEMKQIYDHFHALGMPMEITMEAFERIFNVGSETEATLTGVSGEDGMITMKFKDVLRMLSERLVGRQEALRARGLIARAREEHVSSKTHPTSRIKAPSAFGSKRRVEGEDILDDPMRNASARRESAYRGLVGGTRKEFDDVRKEMEALDVEKRELVSALEEKRRQVFLMGILERREAVRLIRLGAGKGMGLLVGDLRKQAATATKDFELIVSSSGQSNITSPNNTQAMTRRPALDRKKEDVWKYRHTTEALANIHALHIRRPRPSPEEGFSSSSREDAEKRLENVLGHLGVPEGRKGVERMKRILVDVAHRRVERKTKIPGKGGEEVNLDLEEKHRNIEEKQERVQEKVNRAVALGWLCEEYVDLIATFQAETAHALSVLLADEGKRVNGYVDLLLAGISQPSAAKLGSREIRRKGFEAKVRELVRSGRVVVWEDVRPLMERAAASESVMQSIGPMRGYIANPVVEGHGSAEKSKRVLERKGKKAEYGFEIAKEISALMGDCRKLK